MNSKTVAVILLALAASLLLQASASPAGAAEEKKQRILVWRIIAGSGVTDKDINSLTGWLASEVENASSKSVISESDIEAILKGEEKKIQCAGNEDVCVAELGSALGVPEVITGDLGRVGDIWILNLRRLDAKKVVVLKRVSRKAKGEITAMVEAISGAVRDLFFDKDAEKKDGTAVIKQNDPEPKKKETTEEEELKKIFGGKEGDSAGLITKESKVKEEKEQSPYSIAGFTSLFVGVGVAAFGGLSMWMMNEKAQSYYDDGDKSDKSAHSTWKYLTIGGYATGGAMIITGIILLAADPGVKPKEAPKEQNENSSVSFGAAPADGALMLLIYGKF